MADASHPFDARRRRPRDWGEALAALPLDTPPLSVWAQIEARLDAADRAASGERATVATIDTTADGASPSRAAPSALPHRRRAGLSVRAWMALAAGFSALTLLPALWFAGRDDGMGSPPIVTHAPSAPNIIVAPTSASREPATVSAADPARPSIAATQVASVDRPSTSTDRASAPPKDAAGIADARDAAAAMPIETAPQATPPQWASVAMPTVAPTPLAPSANADTTVDASDALPPGAVLVGDVDADVTGREMEMLYAASAQLETLLTYTHDPRVETGPAAALASQIHTRLAKIDARLAMPGLSDDEQYALWRARVGTLRQALAFESEQRALAAEGQLYEGELVEVY